MLFVTGLDLFGGFLYFFMRFQFITELGKMEAFMEIFICVVNRKGWSQDRQGSQEGLNNPLPAWP